MKSLKLMNYFVYAVLIGLMAFTSSCKKDDDEDDNNQNDSGTDYALVIENGAQNVEPNETLTYSAVLVDADGNTSTPDNISWSVTPDSVATFNGGVLNPSSTGDAKVTATVNVDGTEIKASVPIGIYRSSFFAVAPSAILYEAGFDIQLEAVYFGDEDPTFSYSSTNESVATVNNSGLVSLESPGECVIEVTASNEPNVKVRVPVMVIAAPSVPLPVTRLELDKYSVDLFKDETAQLSATAYDAENNVVDTEISWSSENTDIATVSSDGSITPLKTGETKIAAEAKGLIAQCDVLVNPDTVVIVSPLYKDMQQGETHQFTATAYENTRNGLGPEYNNVNFNWEIPDYGPGFEMFNIATVDNSGNVTVKNDAMAGMSTIVIAYDESKPAIGGGAMIMVDVGMPF